MSNMKHVAAAAVMREYAINVETVNLQYILCFLDCTLGIRVQYCHTLHQQPWLVIVSWCEFLSVFIFAWVQAALTSPQPWITEWVFYMNLFFIYSLYWYNINRGQDGYFCGEGENWWTSKKPVSPVKRAMAHVNTFLWKKFCHIIHVSHVCL